MRDSIFIMYLELIDPAEVMVRRAGMAVALNEAEA